MQHTHRKTTYVLEDFPVGGLPSGRILSEILMLRSSIAFTYLVQYLWLAPDPLSQANHGWLLRLPRIFRQSSEFE